MAKAVRGDKRFDAKIHRMIIDLRSALAGRKYELDLDTIYALLEFGCYLIKNATPLIKIRVAQIKSGKDTAAKKLKNKK